MRVGQNPAKSIKTVSRPQKVTVAIITHVPFLGGYHAESLDILKTCLASIWQNTDQPYDLMVFDNASCREVRDYLTDAHARGEIQYLVLSQDNIGKAGAWNFIFGAAPGEYVAYADSDVYFYPGWLSALLGAMKTFPQAGMVTGMPLLNPEDFSTSTLRWAEAHPEMRLESGRLLSWQDFWRHAGTFGGDEGAARAFYERHQSNCIYSGDQKFYVGAGHFQFLAPRHVLQQALPLPSSRPMGDVRQLDVAINELGYLRLSTSEWWVEHIGNSLHGWQPGEKSLARSVDEPRRARSGFWAWKPIRKLLSYLHDKSFELLYGKPSRLL